MKLPPPPRGGKAGTRPGCYTARARYSARALAIKKPGAHGAGLESLWMARCYAGGKAA